MQNTLFKELTKYVSFNILGMLGLSCYILADTYFVASGLGADGLAALNIAIAIYSLINGIGLMIGIGGATRYAICRTTAKPAQANRSFTAAVAFAVGIGILLTLTGIFFSQPLSWLLGARGEVFVMTNTYLKTLLCFAPCFILNNVLIAFVRNDGAPRLSMTGMLVSSFSNILLDYIFIFPLGMGIFGAALATGLAPIFSMCVLSIHAFQKKNQFHLERMGITLRTFIDICCLGAFSLITELSASLSLIVYNLLILGLAGNVGVAAYGVVANLAFVVLAIFNGIAQGTQPVISRCHGQGNEKNARHALQYAAVLALALAALTYAVTFFFTDSLIAPFNGENNVQLAQIAYDGLHVYFIGFLFAGLNTVVAAYLSACEKPVRSFVISITRGFIANLLFVFLFSSIWGLGGIWLTFPVAEAFTLILSFCFSRNKRLHN